jgi:Ni,Fe-hydrogenase maturation factor
VRTSPTESPALPAGEKRSEEHVIVLGLGNTAVADDAVGVLAAHILSKRLLSCHDLNFVTALDPGRALGFAMPRRVTLFTVEVADVETVCERLTPAVEAALPRLVEAVLDTLKRIGAPDPPACFPKGRGKGEEDTATSESHQRTTAREREHTSARPRLLPRLLHRVDRHRPHVRQGGRLLRHPRPRRSRSSPSHPFLHPAPRPRPRMRPAGPRPATSRRPPVPSGKGARGSGIPAEV